MTFKYAQYDRKFKMRIHGDLWEFYKITLEEMDELAEDDSTKAITHLEEHTMFFVETEINKGLVIHELFHVEVSYMNLGSANISVDQFEEVVAEFLEYNLVKFTRLSNKIFNKINKI